MNKSKQKTRATYDQDVINVLHKKWGYSRNYIIKFLSGERQAIHGDRIIKEYHQLVKAAKQAEREKQQKLEQLAKN